MVAIRRSSRIGVSWMPAKPPAETAASAEPAAPVEPVGGHGDGRQAQGALTGHPHRDEPCVNPMISWTTDRASSEAPNTSPITMITQAGAVDVNHPTDQW